MSSKRFVVTHPDNLSDLRAVSAALSLAHDGGFFGMRIVTNKHMPRYCTEYRPPNSKLIEHEKSDEVWLKYFGMGHYAETKAPLFLQMTEPELWPSMQPLARLSVS